MELILLQRVENLGKMGDIVKVRSGYARNFLLPKKIALRATKENLAHFEKEKEALETLNINHIKEAEGLAKTLKGTLVTIIRQASEGGQLYGSVTPKDITESLKNDKVTRHSVKIMHPIKTIGVHAAKVQLHPEVSVDIIINVAMSEDEAKAQAKALEQMTAHTESNTESN
ncbi:50S ribosomal protein L9 [Geitlerinema splendidum]|jgi:large subunit ribosomal protein L9|nr:50S ribosomal protein L9 [Geitlerinema splendidum]